MIATIIFDLDGTLLDTAEEIFDCVQLAFNRVLPDAGKIRLGRTDINLTLRDLICQVNPSINETALNRVCDAFKAEYDTREYLKTKVYDGVYQTLEKLASCGISQFIATNKRIIPTRRLLSYFKLSLFKEVVAYDMFSGIQLKKKESLQYLLRKWKLDPAETLMVGDSVADIAAAHENDVPAVAVMYGYGAPEAILQSQPDFTIQSICELLALIREVK